MSDILSDYLSEDDTAKELGVCLRTVRRWRDVHQGPAFTRLGRRILYRRGAIADFLLAQERKGQAA
jgi:helix-turn-helix protein